MTRDPRPQVEFGRPVCAEQIGERGTVHELTANEAERAALVRRFGLVSLERLTATVRLRQIKKGLVKVTGQFVADLAQRCVVTLEPVPAHLAEEFSVLFCARPARAGRDVVVTAEAEDPPEPMAGGWIDLGETVVQQFAIALDPYPRVPGATIPAEFAVEGVDKDERRKTSPFAILAARRIGR